MRNLQLSHLSCLILAFMFFGVASLFASQEVLTQSQAESPKLYRTIGLMSGTSMDGIDAALIETDGKSIIKGVKKKKFSHSLSYQPEFHLLLKSAEYAVRAHEGRLEEVKKNSLYSYAQDYMTKESRLDASLAQTKWEESLQYMGRSSCKDLMFDDVVTHSTQLHAQVLEELLHKAALKAEDIDVVGYHGQTLFHRPSAGITVQVGDGEALAKKLRITVVNDFRSNDVRHGGQGAPFAPLYHQALAVRDRRIPLAVVNCGGIGNISLVLAEEACDLVGFDTGPGNGLVDRFVKRKTGLEESMDVDGKYGSRGQVNQEVLHQLYNKALNVGGQNYFSIKPPKSLDINDMNLIPELDDLSLEDGCATLEAFTADTIVRALSWFPEYQPKFWVLSGGGWYNPVIKKELIQRIRANVHLEAVVLTVDEIGWSSRAMEAQIFAYLAVRSLQGEPISVPETTRVPRPLSGGHAHVPPSGATDKVRALLEVNPAVSTGYKEN